jgi:hypothetical protein
MGCIQIGSIPFVEYPGKDLEKQADTRMQKKKGRRAY